jgi:hypothetical protein
MLTTNYDKLTIVRLPPCRTYMKHTQVIQEFPGYYWQWDGFQWQMMWEPVRNVYSPPCLHPGVVRHEVQVPLQLHDKVGLLIGSNGQNFIRITTQTGCFYIFYRSTHNKVEVWGHAANVMHATRRIQSCLGKMLEKKED